MASIQPAPHQTLNLRMWVEVLEPNGERRRGMYLQMVDALPDAVPDIAAMQASFEYLVPLLRAKLAESPPERLVPDSDAATETAT